MRKFGLTLFILLTTLTFVNAQKKTLDKIAGVVGSGIILQSDIESQYAQYLIQGNPPNPSIKCLILQQLLTQKLLAQQAVIDSVFVKDDEVDAEVDRRMRSMVQRAGGEERLEQFLGRSIIQYKDELRPDIKEQRVAEKMRQKITEKVNVTPFDIKKYFDAIPKDSLPTYNKEVEVGEISITPKLTAEEKKQFKDKAESLRARVKGGEDFGNLARLYSQDPGSSPDGGDLGFADRSTFVKEFAAMAFKLKAGEISPVFETDFGFHFLQVIERRGEQVHVRHILIKTEVSQGSLDRAKVKIDSVYTLLSGNKKIDFSSAAAYYSDDRDTKYNGGMMLNADNVQSRTTYIPTDKLDPQVALVVDTMKIGEISKPALFTAQDGKKTYKILLLKSKTDAHKANLAQDLPKIKDLAYEDKLNKSVSEWFEKKRKDTYVKIDPEYQSCPQLKIWASSPSTAQVK
ncbi:peptidylprolyl isomerase [Mucilaginibacter paludis]|uniref:PpiC-type peptidyl-prolyl cis-trans isomerase n=1 Tax=Mucilaginibacter paludis DSM 18603 TaxID=714943 RepID=H1Y4B3_9SPHI|nr:peptidylprolyl isomerase [Mucilaginibacter paludis]EHQ25747.1 PpiC-type peptidyl-prolyl cis-trans isomerase [Mucilaginibacter paludis DSM 18603]